jgi:hypothetical protein
VPNWSFEDTLSCPDNLGQVDKAIGWSSYRVSPDYFNACADTISPWGGSVTVPKNYFDFQYPKSGNAYVGLYTLSLGGGNVREMIGIQLSQPLTIGQEYFASFYACRVGVVTGQHKKYRN